MLVFPALLLLYAVVAGVPVLAQEKVDVKPVQREDQTEAPLTVTLGKAEVVGIEGAFSDILVANPNIIEVSALNTNKIYVVGKEIGDTNVIVMNDDGDVVRHIDIHVTYDLKAIQAMVEKFFPDERVSVKSVHDQVVLTGTASSPEKAERISQLVGHYVGDLQGENNKTPDQMIVNMLEVQGEMQVMLRVKIVEASRSILKELGVESNFNDPNELAEQRLFNNTPPGTLPTGPGNLASQILTNSQLALTEDPFGTGQMFLDPGIGGLGILNLMVSALEKENLVNTLAEPNLTAISGETAGFLAGGEFPVPVGRDQIGNIVIEFHPFGVSLNFKPTVLSSDRISLQLETEVSSLNFEDGVPLSGGASTATFIPAFDVRRASTTVEMASGGSLMIAGLLSSNATKGLAGLPGIRDTPVLGDLMKSDSFQRNESELLIMVTPYLVKPKGDPTNAELVKPRANNPLAEMFAGNLHKLYAIREDDPVFEDDLRYGYILN
ncbi:MAG: type II and III secretion system protein family protein [Alphaproteobacteria bacterium]|nr:type II and III secretion system protein family protein [Alphaproteobacteria bacterium]